MIMIVHPLSILSCSLSLQFFPSKKNSTSLALESALILWFSLTNMMQSKWQPTNFEPRHQEILQTSDMFLRTLLCHKYKFRLFS